jgi:hypothetical protein
VFFVVLGFVVMILIQVIENAATGGPMSSSSFAPSCIIDAQSIMKEHGSGQERRIKRLNK